MKIAYLSTFYPFRGGIAQFNASLYRALEMEHEVKAFNFKRQYPEFLFPGKTQLVQPGDSADPIAAIPILDTVNPLTYFSAAREINRFEPNLLITKFWMPFFAPSLGTVARQVRKKGCRNIALLDNVIPHEKRPGDMSLIRFFLNSYDAFITMSDEVTNDLLSLKPSATFTHHLHPLYDHFPPSIDQGVARAHLSIPTDKKVLLFFGFIRDYKGLDLLLDALSILDNSYHLVIAGEVYGSFDKYEKQIDRLALRDKVTIHTHYISDSEVAAYYSAADVCMLTYKSATQSGITSIAFHYNLPVVVSNVGGLKEVVEPYNTGLVCEPESNSICNAITRFFSTEKQVYIKNINAFKTKSSWKNLSKTILSL